VCVSLCAIAVNKTPQNSYDNHPSYPPAQTPGIAAYFSVLSSSYRNLLRLHAGYPSSQPNNITFRVLASNSQHKQSDAPPLVSGAGCGSVMGKAYRSEKLIPKVSLLEQAEEENQGNLENSY